MGIYRPLPDGRFALQFPGKTPSSVNNERGRAEVHAGTWKMRQYKDRTVVLLFTTGADHEFLSWEDRAHRID